MKAQGIKLASERSVRRLSEEMLGDNLAATEVPLSQPLRFGVDLKVSPLVYVPDLVGKILQLLEQNDRLTVRVHQSITFTLCTCI